MELVVYLAVFTIFIYLTTGIFTAVLDVQLESDTTSVVQQDSRFIIERITYDIHRAESITTPSSPGEQSSILQLLIDGETHIYSLNTGNLELTNNTGTARLNSNETSISNLTFNRIGNSGGNHSIIIDYINESIVERRTGPEQIQVHTAINTR